MDDNGNSIINTFELADWVFKKVEQKVEVIIEEFRQEIKKQIIDAPKSYKELLKIKAMHDEREDAISFQTKALNDRTNNLQKIYDKIIVIDKKLEGIKEVAKLFSNEDMGGPVEFEQPNCHQIKIDDCKNLNRRTKNTLKLEGINTLGCLVKMSLIEVFKMPMIGLKSCREIEKELSYHGLRFRVHDGQKKEENE